MVESNTISKGVSDTSRRGTEAVIDAGNQSDSLPRRLRATPWRFRVTAIALGLLPIVASELFLRALGSGAPRVPDALSGFNPVVPLFERHANLYLTSPAHQPFFPAQQFLAEKSRNEFRIFCLGGSTVHGHPYQSETAFPNWLEMELGGADSNHVYRAINCGGVSYASYRLEPLVREVLQYQPDLIVVATGENEFLEDRTYHSLKERSGCRKWLESQLYSLRIVNVARNWLFKRSGEGSVLPLPCLTDHPAQQNESTRPWTAFLRGVEVRTKLDERSGYASYHRDAAWYDRVAAQFEESVRSMVTECRKAQVPIVLIKLGSNLRDCPPYKSEHRMGLSSEDERHWQSEFDRATHCETLNPAAARENYFHAEQIDPDYALLSFRLGQNQERSQKPDQALRYYLKARDDDICPLRMPARHEEILERISKETGTTLVDASGVIASRSLDHLPGNDWYLDHVHPNIGGHQTIAHEIAAELRRAGIVSSAGGWSDQQRRQAFTRHLEGLSPGYYADGRRRVEWLESWARREKLQDEAEPKDAGGFVRAGFRRLELGDEEAGVELIRKGITAAPQMIEALRTRANELESEGRSALAGRLRSAVKS